MKRVITITLLLALLFLAACGGGGQTVTETDTETGTGKETEIQTETETEEESYVMTDISGILRDKDDDSSLIPEVTVTEAKALYTSGIISGGMIPKVDCCIEAIEQGVKNVVIMDGRVPHSILLELLTNEGAGTWIRRDKA